jgi:hypothetical protein
VFADRFGRPGKDNDNGKGEGLIGWVRRNLLVPVPRAASLAGLNEQLLEGCRRRLGDRLRGHDATIGERLVRDLAAFHDLPPVPYDACETKAGRVSSLSLVRYRGTDDSVPTADGHRAVMICGDVDAVVISCGADVIAHPPRSYARGFRLHPAALSGSARTQNRRSRPGGAAGWLGPARGIRHPALPARGAPGQARQTRVRPDPAPARGLPPRGRAGRRQSGDCRWRDRL